MNTRNGGRRGNRRAVVAPGAGQAAAVAQVVPAAQAGQPPVVEQVPLAAQAQAVAAGNRENEDEVEGGGLQELFREPVRDGAGAWADAEITAGSRGAVELVTQQRATRLQACARAIMATPHVGPGLVFITVLTHNAIPHTVVWQIDDFTAETQKFMAQRTSNHPANLAIPFRVIFSLATVEVLVSPTLPFLNLILEAMGPTKAAAVARFPLADKIMVPSAPIVNALTHSLEFEVRNYDSHFQTRLVVALPREDGLPAAAAAGETTDTSRRVVRSVPSGTHHWYLCDECMLVGSRSEELVYNSMIHGGARSAPGSAMQLGIVLPLRISPKEARNILSLRITSSLSFDTVTEAELLALRYGTDKGDVSRFRLGECARLAYRRVCNCQELLFRIFHLKPHVMHIWSGFAAQILYTIEHGAARFPGVATNGVINRYVELVLQTFFAQLHTPGLTASGSDAALTLLKLDVTSDVFVRFQLDAELHTRGGCGSGGQKRPPSGEPLQAPEHGAPLVNAKKPRSGEKTSVFCFSSFSTDGCKHGSACRFSHKKPTSEVEKAAIRAGVAQRNGTLRGDAF
jgi:hypothetical protein